MACVKLIVVGLLFLAGSALAQTTIIASPVAGKLGYNPSSSKLFSEAVIIPATSTAYLSGTGGNNATEITAETAKAMDGLNATLTALGSSMNAVVKTTVYLTNIEEWAEMNTVYSTYFGAAPPARTAFEVAALVGTSRIEIDMIAVDPVFSTMKASS